MYRIFIKSRKWTLRLIFHAFDLAIVNSWFKYRRDCEIVKIPGKSQLDLLTFRTQVADCLIKMGNPVKQSKRGRPSSDMRENIPNKRRCG